MSLADSKRPSISSSWLGLTPSENIQVESQNKRRDNQSGKQASKTHTVESLFSTFMLLHPSKDLCKRTPLTPAEDTQTRNKAATGKEGTILRTRRPENKANIATNARELAGWVWAVGKIAEEN